MSRGYFPGNLYAYCKLRRVVIFRVTRTFIVNFVVLLCYVPLQEESESTAMAATGAVYYIAAVYYIPDPREQSEPLDTK